MVGSNYFYNPGANFLSENFSLAGVTSNNCSYQLKTLKINQNYYKTSKSNTL